MFPRGNTSATMVSRMQIHDIKSNSFQHCRLCAFLTLLISNYIISGMYVRTALAALDHNHSIDRHQAVTRSGAARFSTVCPKSHQRWIARPIKVSTSALYGRQRLLYIEVFICNLKANYFQIPNNIFPGCQVV